MPRSESHSTHYSTRQAAQGKDNGDDTHCSKEPPLGECEAERCGGEHGCPPANEEDVECEKGNHQETMFAAN
jgi:hypothetical protein